MSKNGFNEYFAKGFRGINKLICHLPIEQKDFVKSLKFDLVHTAKMLFPDKSMSELSQITGVSRGTLSEYLDQKVPEEIVSKEAVLLNQLWINKDENDSIPLKGDFSFFSIAKDILNSSYSPSSALNSLIELKAVKLSDLEAENISVIILQNYLDIAIKEKYELYIDEIGATIEKLCDTVINNMHNDDFNYQQRYFSSQIPITSQNKAHLELKSLANKTLMPLVRECIDQFEEDVPDGTYPELGFSMFEYRDYIKSK
ncbi:MAG: hypothetical protein JKX98_05825 [Alcanivoracaceae bacterium]|nr:hypothetical protein [Alcanivoracaceae bacterium]